MTVEDTMADPRRLPPCLACNAPTRWRQSARGAFVGCSRFPKCRAVISISDLARMLEKHRTGTAIAAGRGKMARTRAGLRATGLGES